MRGGPSRMHSSERLRHGHHFAAGRATSAGTRRPDWPCALAQAGGTLSASLWLLGGGTHVIQVALDVPTLAWSVLNVAPRPPKSSLLKVCSETSTEPRITLRAINAANLPTFSRGY